MLETLKKNRCKSCFKFHLYLGIWMCFCCVFSFSALAQSSVENLSENASSTSVSGTLAAKCSTSGCAKMYPEDNISQLHHKYESAGNPCAFNNCVAGDVGGCSYGSSQLECTYGSLKTFLTNLQSSNPSIWDQLGGGSVEEMNARACAAPATDFSSKWKSICSNSQASADFEAAQEKYMQKMYYDTAAKAIKKNYGIDFNTLAPELQMALFSAAVALGSPGGVNKLMKSIKNNIGDPAQMSEAELLEAMYVRRDYFYGSSSEAIRASVQRRNAKEGSEALESLKIREAWEAEQQKPTDQQKSYEEVVKEVTGRDVCTGNQSGNFNCGASGVSGSSGSSSGSSSSSSGNVSSGGNSSSTNNSDKTCAPSQYKMSYGSCMLCPLFAVIFNTASNIAKLTFDKLALPVLTVVLVAWALWIASQILIFVSSFKTVDAPTLIKTLLNKSFVVLVVVVFLQSDSGTFFAMIMEPIFNTGFKLAQMAASDQVCSVSQYHLIQDGGLPVSMGQSILCALQAIQQRLLDTMSLGAATMCVGLYVKGALFIFPSFPYLISGLFIFCGAAIVIVIFPFLLVDSIFHLTVACALLPAAIGAYPFKITSKYCKEVWSIFMNAIFNFVFMSLVIYVLTGAIENTIMEGGVGKLTDSNFQEAIITTFVWGGVTLLKIIFILLLTWVILEEVNTYAGQFAPSRIPGGIGSQIGGMAAQGTKQIGKKAWSGAKEVGGTLAENAKEKLGDMRRNVQTKYLQKHGTEKLLTDKEGNVIGRTYEIKGKSWARGRDKTQTLTIMNNGTKMIETNKDYGNGKVVTSRSDGYLKQVEVTQKDEKTGAVQVVSSSLEIQTAGMKAARNSDGSLNVASLNQTLQNSAFSEKMVKAAVLQQYARASGINISGSISESNVHILQDEQGREVVEIVNKDANSAGQTLRMHLPLDDTGNRVLVESITTDAKGNEVALATDGMVNRKSILQYNSQTGNFDKSERFALSDYYAQRLKYGVDVNGNFADIFDKHGGLAFNMEDQLKIQKAFLKQRQKSKRNQIGELK